MISKPQDLVIIFGIFAAVIVTVSFGVDSINSKGAGLPTTFFDSIEANVTDPETGFVRISGSTAEDISGYNASTDQDNRDSFLNDAFNSVIRLGHGYSLVKLALRESFAALGIDPIYLIILTVMLLASFLSVLYLWIRGVA